MTVSTPQPFRGYDVTASWNYLIGSGYNDVVLRLVLFNCYNMLSFLGYVWLIKCESTKIRIQFAAFVVNVLSAGSVNESTATAIEYG